MRKFKLPLAVIITALLFATFAWAQQQVLISGAQDGTGTLRYINVDSQGRIVISNPGGGTSSDAGTVFNVTTWFPDGGYIGQVQTRPCAAVANKVVSVGTSSTAVPATTLANRSTVLICNSAENAGSPLLKCRQDNTAVATGIVNPGEVLQVGDCVQYAVASGTNCISNAASTAASVTECAY